MKWYFEFQTGFLEPKHETPLCPVQATEFTVPNDEHILLIVLVMQIADHFTYVLVVEGM